MPLTAKGEKILSNLEGEYGAEKAERVLYAGKNKGTFTGIDAIADACQAVADEVEALHRRMDARDAGEASREDAGKKSIEQRVAIYRRALEEGKITVKEFDGFMEALAKEGSGRADSEIDDIKDKLSAMRAANADPALQRSLIRRLEELRSAGGAETERATPKTLGEMFTSAGATRKRRDDANKEEFSFTNPAVPLFGAKYEETKRKAQEAMKKLRELFPDQGRGDANSPDYDAALARFREAGAKFREAQRAYRAREIGDQQFLAAKTAFNQASSEMDRATPAGH